MRQFAIAVATAVAMAATACAERSDDSLGTASDMEERRVMAAEDAYVAAEVGRDEASLRRLVDDRFVHNSADGTTSGKEDLIRTVLGLNMTGEAISERSVMVEGNMAFVFGTAERRVRDPGAAERSSRLRYTSVYVKRDDEWRMLALHMQPRSVR